MYAIRPNNPDGSTWKFVSTMTQRQGCLTYIGMELTSARLRTYWEGPERIIRGKGALESPLARA